VAHPGVTSHFLNTTGHELSLIYNDSSPCENMHAHRFFSTLKREDHNWLDNFKAHTFSAFRAKVIAAILSTDMAHHFSFVDRFDTRARKILAGDMVTDTKDEGQDRTTSQHDRQMLIEAFLHTADVGINFKEFRIQMVGVRGLEEEWFAQGDLERQMGIPISPNSDRHKDSAARVQTFFLGRMLQPLLDPCCLFFNPETAQLMNTNLKNNIEQWEKACTDFPGMTACRLVPLLASTNRLAGAEYEESTEVGPQPSSPPPALPSEANIVVESVETSPAVALREAGIREADPLGPSTRSRTSTATTTLQSRTASALKSNTNQSGKSGDTAGTAKSPRTPKKTVRIQSE